MGSGCCNNLVRKGYDVTVFDISKEAMELFSGKATFAAGIEEVFTNCEVTFLSLPGYQDVEAVTDVFLALKTSGKTVIDLSTSTPVSSSKIYEKFKAAGNAFLDAPLTGIPKTAEEGTLVINVGGDRDVYESCEEVLAAFSKKSNYIGGPGGGNLVKLMNNFLSIMYAGLYAECFPLAEKMGYDVQKIHEIIAESGVNCTNYQINGKKIVDKEFIPAFALDFCIKDLSYFKMLYDEQKAPSLLLDAGLSLYKLGHVKGYGSDDVSAVAKVVYDNLGIEYEKVML
jgi:3-hydroxyisobutyrate dehydrogenase-like beta-hydroxyacid dehydrogenase